jgi:hypothetical protein
LRGADPLRPGRKPHTEPDAVFGMVLTGYGLFGPLRFTGGLKAARRAGDRSRRFQGAKVSQFMANRPERPGAAAVRGAVRRRTAPVNRAARAVRAPAAGRSRRGPGECITGRLG